MYSYKFIFNYTSGSYASDLSRIGFCKLINAFLLHTRKIFFKFEVMNSECLKDICLLLTLKSKSLTSPGKVKPDLSFYTNFHVICISARIDFYIPIKILSC